jgi:DNA-binding NtrC family response regulator
MKPRLLAADPDPILLQIYRAFFPTFGFEAATARDGLECVALLHEFAPDVLVLSLDLCWGGADGVLSIIREETQIRPIPVVLVVGETSRATAVKYLFPPVVKLVDQGFRLGDLREIVETALHTRGDRLMDEVGGTRAAFAGDTGRPLTDHNSLTAHIHRGEIRNV